MAVIQQLSVGYPQLMIQSQIYAMPVSKLTQVTCDDATATFTVSNDGVLFTAPNPAPTTPGGYGNGAAFIQVTNKNATINIRRWV